MRRKTIIKGPSREHALIDVLKRRVEPAKATICGIGDDCAVLPKDAKYYTLYAIDTTAEGVHFLTQEHTPSQIGYKALARNISDIAAMGGVPTHAVIALMLPSGIEESYVKALYAGMRKCASRYGVAIVGGDITKADSLILSVSIVGKVEKRNVIYRSGAKPGDKIYVTGTFGGSRRKKHVSFMPRVKESRFLIESCKPTSMIDISDGLVADIGHIARASNVKCTLDLTQIPISHDALFQADRDAQKALQSALTDGEDFELAFTVSKHEALKLEAGWKKKKTLAPIRCIGAVGKGRGVEFLQKDKIFKTEGYSHR